MVVLVRTAGRTALALNKEALGEARFGEARCASPRRRRPGGLIQPGLDIGLDALALAAALISGPSIDSSLSGPRSAHKPGLADAVHELVVDGFVDRERARQEQATLSRIGQVMCIATAGAT